MVVIRLSRTGRKNAPSFRVTVADRRRCRDGKYLENVGWFNPTKTDQKEQLTLDIPAIESWIKKGAQPSQTVKELIKKFNQANKH